MSCTTALKKAFRGTGTLNLADKAKKQEIVRAPTVSLRSILTMLLPGLRGEDLQDADRGQQGCPQTRLVCERGGSCFSTSIPALLQG